MKIGILGGGQLGRMLAMAGHALGMRFRFLDVVADACAGQVGELIVGRFDDLEALGRFAAGIDVVTYEFENIDPFAIEWLAGRVPVKPGLASLLSARDRLEERRLFARMGLATPRWFEVASAAQAAEAAASVGGPCLLKARRGGYDGKGQVRLESPRDAAEAWRALGASEAIVDEVVPFQREVSLVGTRSEDGEMAFYPLVENEHEKGILRRTVAPAGRIDEHAAFLARHGAAQLVTSLDHIGTFAIEFFEVDGVLLANEWAPRVHNSAHWTIEGAVTSQFENHVRAVAGLPLGDASARGRAEMLNLIGSLPSEEEVLSIRGAHLHVYGKAAAPGRKVGHLTFVDGREEDVASARARISAR